MSFDLFLLETSGSEDDLLKAINARAEHHFANSKSQPVTDDPATDARNNSVSDLHSAAYHAAIAHRESVIAHGIDHPKTDAAREFSHAVSRLANAQSRTLS